MEDKLALWNTNGGDADAAERLLADYQVGVYSVKNDLVIAVSALSCRMTPRFWFQPVIYTTRQSKPVAITRWVKRWVSD